MDVSNDANELRRRKDKQLKRKAEKELAAKEKQRKRTSRAVSFGPEQMVTINEYATNFDTPFEDIMLGLQPGYNLLASFSARGSGTPATTTVTTATTAAVTSTTPAAATSTATHTLPTHMFNHPSHGFNQFGSMTFNDVTLHYGVAPVYNSLFHYHRQVDQQIKQHNDIILSHPKLKRVIEDQNAIINDLKEKLTAETAEKEKLRERLDKSTDDVHGLKQKLYDAKLKDMVKDKKINDSSVEISRLTLDNTRLATKKEDFERRWTETRAELAGYMAEESDHAYLMFLRVFKLNSHGDFIFLPDPAKAKSYIEDYWDEDDDGPMPPLDPFDALIVKKEYLKDLFVPPLVLEPSSVVPDTSSAAAVVSQIDLQGTQLFVSALVSTLDVHGLLPPYVPVMPSATQCLETPIFTSRATDLVVVTTSTLPTAIENLVSADHPNLPPIFERNIEERTHTPSDPSLEDKGKTIEKEGCFEKNEGKGI